MRYSSGMKAAILKRVLPPNNETIVSVSQDTGVAKATISYWKKQAADGILEPGDGPLRPSDRSSAEKLTLLLEGRGVEKDQHGEWLRSHGLHSEHLPLWEQELRDIVTDKEKKQREELADLKRKNKELEKELQRKDKALAETAALLGEFRKDLAEHVRETVRFARNVNHSMERLWVYLRDHNLSKRYRINDPVALDRTHCDEAGGDRARVLAATARLTTRRRFLSFQRLEPALLRVWRREHHTPLHNAAKGVLREISRAAHSGEVDLERVKESLQIESLTVERTQYLPKYALA